MPILLMRPDESFSVPADIMEIRDLLERHKASHIPIISKIENDEGLERLDEIVEASDGIMVARGDLGVEIPIEQVPIVQKEIIRKCNLAGKPVITATHMLDSMQMNPRPTRAEASDVANAVLDGTDAVMLSGETAAGKYPVESVAKMSEISEKAESVFVYRDPIRIGEGHEHTLVTEVISQAAVRSSLELGAKAIVTPTESGYTARMVSKYRPSAPIIAVAPNDCVLKRLCLTWGVFPVKGERIGTTDELFASAIRNGSKAGLIGPGDLVVITAGVPAGQSGTTNLIKIGRV